MIQRRNRKRLVVQVKGRGYAAAHRIPLSLALRRAMATWIASFGFSRAILALHHMGFNRGHFQVSLPELPILGPPHSSTSTAVPPAPKSTVPSSLMASRSPDRSTGQCRADHDPCGKCGPAFPRHFDRAERAEKSRACAREISPLRRPPDGSSRNDEWGEQTGRCRPASCGRVGTRFAARPAPVLVPRCDPKGRTRAEILNPTAMEQVRTCRCGRSGETVPTKTDRPYPPRA